MRTTVVVVLLVVLFLPTVPAHADGMSAAKDISSALSSGDLGRAMSTWEMEESSILDSVDASFVAGEAIASFGSKPEVLRYRDLPDQCAEMAGKCVDAVDEALLETDLTGRLRLSRLQLKLAWLYRKCGKGAEADKHEDGAKKHLEAITADESAGVEAFIALGQVYVALVEREPPKAEEHIQKATELYAKAREKAGNSASLCLSEGKLKVRLAELKSDQMTKNPKDRKLPKAVKSAYEEAMECFEKGIKLDEKSKELKTAFNECLWMCMRCNKGKSKCDPILVQHDSRYRKLRIMLPDSEWWHIEAKEKMDEDNVFEAWKYDEKEGKGLTILIREYRWDTNYRNMETNEVVGGDNIGGLAKMSDRDVRDIFEDIRERMPLRKARLKRIPKVEAFSVNGKTKSGRLREWKAYFFKHSKVQKTFKVTVIATLGMEKHNPYELQVILGNLELSRK